MRIAVHEPLTLISVTTGKTVWAEKYDESFTNIFAVQDEISERLARTLAPRLSAGNQQIPASWDIPAGLPGRNSR
jgi:TolB-like protein